jgi:tetratricopeptide (TPR) repeat protein
MSITQSRLTPPVKPGARDSGLLLLAILILAVATLTAGSVFGDSRARVWEEPLVLPTYEVNDPDHNPRFYAGRAYQGAQGRVYPYPMIDDLTDHRVEKTYRAVYLENEYIKVCLLPELGGRVLSAVDKTNQYDFFYRQTVIKPALIGMIGAWISGGIEWNFPHHHRPTVFMPIDYTFEEHPDGSVTAWIGEMEIRHRMRWVIGLTVYPGKSYLEATLKPINRTPFIQSFLFFANAGTHSNENYQVFFPPGTEYVTYHGKNQFAHWPVSREVFNEIDYSEGVDLSWWKNHPEWTSMFAWNYDDDFFAGYDHGKRAGTVSVANHHVAPGKKFWEWSAGPRGTLWDHILTEKDGPELELMSGAYSDNQPDYSWLQPLESKIVRLYWFPIRELGGLKYADLEGALNFEAKPGGKVRMALNTVASHRGATAAVKAGERVIYSQAVDISPAQPFSAEVELPAGTNPQELRVSLTEASGRELLAYQEKKKKGEPMPEPVKPPLPPKEIATVEELYYAGLRLEQFFNPALEPDAYYEEALRRDPDDSRVNLALGIRNLKRGKFEDAEHQLRTALKRPTHNFTSPRDGEALYYLGLALRFQGKHREAVEPLYKSTWSYAFHTPAYYQLAEISAREGDYAEALDQVTRALATNQWSGKAANLKATLLRKSGRPADALAITEAVLKEDPLDFWAGYEQYLARKALGRIDAEEQLKRQRKLMREDAQSYLELGVDYAGSGSWDEAISVLSLVPRNGAKEPTGLAMVDYYLGYFWGEKGDQAKQVEFFGKASKATPRFVFPFRLESIAVLRKASEINPRDARAPYYLGNLLFDEQPAAALKEWEKARALDPGFATAHRNLAIAYQQVEHDLAKAVASIEKAVECDSSDARLLYELDALYERAGTAHTKRLSMLEKNRATVEKRDDAVSRLVLLYVQTGRYDEATQLLAERHFNVWEGSRGLRDAYEDVYLLRGLSRFARKDYRGALAEYQKTLEFPLNLENAWPYRGGRMPELYYFIATAHEALGEDRKAREFYGKAVEAKQREEWSDLRYYQAMAEKKLGATERAEILLDGLMEFASTDPGSSVDFFSKFGDREPLNVRQARHHYLRGLVHRGRGNVQESRSEFEKALALDVNQLWARVQLDLLPN